jgi:hypothetical protein
VVAVCGGTSGLERPVGLDTMSQFLAEAVQSSLLKTAREFGIDGDVFVTTPTESGVITSGFDEKGTPLWGPEWEAAQSNNS